ncbi:MAG: GNAT family N-acetyltransferase [Polyangiaceae bacterium]|jgi:N-acetyltransferase
MTDRVQRFIAIRDARPDDAAWASMSWPPDATSLAGHVVELIPCVPDRDASALFQALNHDAVWRHVAGRPRDPGEYSEILARRIAEGRFVWVVRLRRPHAGLAPGAVVGTSSYLEVSVGDARLEIGATAYTPSVWSTKVNPDTKLRLLAYAFETLGAGRVQLKTDVRNIRSQEAIARLGARYEGTIRRYQRRDDGSVRDTVLFSIVAEEWPAVREALRERVGV